MFKSTIVRNLAIEMIKAGKTNHNIVDELGIRHIDVDAIRKTLKDTTKPVTKAPAKPVTKPVAKTPAKPATKAPTKTPAKPVAKAPTKTPAKPATKPVIGAPAVSSSNADSVV